MAAPLNNELGCDLMGGTGVIIQAGLAFLSFCVLIGLHSKNVRYNAFISEKIL